MAVVVGVLIGVLGTVLVGTVVGVVMGRLRLLGLVSGTRRYRGAPPDSTSHEAADDRPRSSGRIVAGVPGLHFEPVGSPRLPHFSDVGGNQAIKEELLATIGMLLAHPDEAQAYRVSWNGILFHGPPGTGKSFMARAMAGEFGLNFFRVSTSDLVTSSVGAGPEQVDPVFARARANLPCLVFFDEFDAVAPRRDDDPGVNARQVLTELLQCLEEYHSEPKLVVVAATNDLSTLDPAVTRPGRFDRVIGLDLPDAATRREIFRASLKGRPCATLDLASCAERCEGSTPAAIVRAVDAAALAALRERIGSDHRVRIATRHLLAALEHRGLQDRPTVEEWNWEYLILPDETLAELKQLQALLQDPSQAGRMGVDQPTGVLLTGPPGTGKTTVGKVLAAESRCSFYPVTGADITSRWVGESERAVARLFAKARDNSPSIVFIDEIDSIAGRRGQLGAYDRQLDQLLQEMDGLRPNHGVFVLGATNRQQAVDPALLRAGRLSRIIEIPLPDTVARKSILGLLTKPMPISGVDIDGLAAVTEGFSGADLKGLCQQAAVQALIRSRHNTRAQITEADFEQALSDEITTITARDKSHRTRPLKAEHE